MFTCIVIASICHSLMRVPVHTTQGHFKYTYFEVDTVLMLIQIRDLTSGSVLDNDLMILI